jgi:hypothetical protein
MHQLVNPGLVDDCIRITQMQTVNESLMKAQHVIVSSITKCGRRHHAASFTLSRSMGGTTTTSLMFGQMPDQPFAFQLLRGGGRMGIEGRGV